MKRSREKAPKDFGSGHSSGPKIMWPTASFRGKPYDIAGIAAVTAEK